VRRVGQPETPAEHAVADAIPKHPQTCGKNERCPQTAQKWLAAHPTPTTAVELQTTPRPVPDQLQQPTPPSPRRQHPARAARIWDSATRRHSKLTDADSRRVPPKQPVGYGSGTCGGPGSAPPTLSPTSASGWPASRHAKGRALSGSWFGTKPPGRQPFKIASPDPATDPASSTTGRASGSPSTSTVARRALLVADAYQQIFEIRKFIS